MDQLPQFPEMVALSQQHIPLLVSFSREFKDAYADINALNLIAWNTDNSTCIAQYSGGLVMRMPDYSTEETIYSFAQPRPDTDTLLAVLHSLQTNDIKPVLKLVPEISILGSKSKEIIIEKDRDNFEYVCKTSDLANIQGSGYRKLRQLVRPLLGSDVLQVKELNLESFELLEDIFDVWTSKKGHDEQEVRLERKAFHNATKVLKSFDSRVFGLFHQETLIGWSIYEIIDDNYAIGHFEKTDGSIQKMSYAFKILVAQKLEKSCKYINFEQDLGIVGLRQSKNTLRPDHFLKTYTVTLRA